MKIDMNKEGFWELVDKHFDASTEKGRIKILLIAGVIFLIGAMFNEVISWLVLIVMIIVTYRYWKKKKEAKKYDTQKYT